MECNQLAVDIDNEIVVVYNFLRDRYKTKFPELEVGGLVGVTNAAASGGAEVAPLVAAPVGGCVGCGCFPGGLCATMLLPSPPLPAFPASFRRPRRAWCTRRWSMPAWWRPLATRWT